MLKCRTTEKDGDLGDTKEQAQQEFRGSSKFECVERDSDITVIADRRVKATPSAPRWTNRGWAWETFAAAKRNAKPEESSIHRFGTDFFDHATLFPFNSSYNLTIMCTSTVLSEKPDIQALESIIPSTDRFGCRATSSRAITRPFAQANGRFSKNACKLMLDCSSRACCTSKNFRSASSSAIGHSRIGRRHSAQRVTGSDEGIADWQRPIDSIEFTF
jgi:hypothetical protein